MKILKIDDSLIISRLEQKELSYIKPSMKEDSQFFLAMGKISLKPFVNNLPINIGLNLQILGDKIIGCQIDSGYFYQDLENQLRYLSPKKAVLYLEHLEPICPIFYQIALILAYEDLLGTVRDIDSERYSIVLEFARISHHLGVCYKLFDFMKAHRLLVLTEEIQNKLREPTRLSSKIAQGISIKYSDLDRMLSDALLLIENLYSLSIEDKRLLFSLKKKAVLNLSYSASLGLSGLFTKANRNNYDVRKTSDLSYKNVPIFTTEGGDAFGRLILRLLEIDASLRWLKKTINSQNNNYLESISLPDNFASTKPVEKFSIGEVSGPEGDIRVSIFTSFNLEEKPIFRIRSSAYYIAQAIPEMLIGLKVHEIPLILHSLGIRAEEVDK
jgi:NADH:ubiquinone oxidoreductase subunit D